MRRLVVTCTCGAKMQAPRSAYGKIGVCSKCGARLRIGAMNTSPLGLPPPGGLGHEGQARRRQTAGGDGDVQQRFGRGVDLFYKGQYAEALAVFDGLAREYPGNAEVQNARARCMKAMQDGTEQSASARPTEDVELDEKTTKNAILDLMLNGFTESTRLQAAELACKALGLFDGDSARSRAGARSHSGIDDAVREAARPGNGKKKGDETTADAQAEREETVAG